MQCQKKESRKMRRSYTSDFTIRLGNITTRGKLMSIRNSESDGDTKTVQITPDVHRVQRVWRGPDGTIYEDGTLGRAIEDADGKLTPVDKDAIAEAKKSALTPNVFELHVHRRSDIDNFLYPDKSQGYVFMPQIKKGKNVVDDPVNDKAYEILNAMVQNPKVAMIGRCNLQNHEGMFRLSMYRGHVVLQKQLYPEEVHEFGVLKIKLDKADRDKAAKLAEAMVTDFDAEDYPNEITKRVIEATSADYDPSTLAVAKAQDQEADLSAMLDAALAEFA